MSRRTPDRTPAPAGPSQRQLRAGELVRHALVEVLREHEIHDPALDGVSITVPEVRMSADLKHATCFIEPLGGGAAAEVTSALNRHGRFLRGALGRQIEMKFTPELRFRHDESFTEAARIEALFDDPRVKRDLETPDTDEGGSDDGPA
jgi:ribosome-binding factor A